MKVDWDTKEIKTVEVCDINPGDCFQFSPKGSTKLYNGRVYMVTTWVEDHEIFVVNVENGSGISLSLDERVVPVKAKVVFDNE